MSLVSLRGSATGSIPIPLAAGVPSGAIALSASPDSVTADSMALRGVTASGLVDAFGNMVADGERYLIDGEYHFSPGAGTWSKRPNSIHSTWPTTAVRSATC